MSLGAILLAAGASTRMGAPKQLIEIDGKTLVRRAAEAAMGTGSDPIVVVLGANLEFVREQLTDMPVCIVENHRWREGMASSIRAGLTEALRLAPDLSAVLITLCDQPLVGGADLLRLIDLYRSEGKLIAAASYGSGNGAPAIFAQPLFPELLRLAGDAGARRVIAAHAHEVAPLDMPSAAIDLDTPIDVESYSAKLH
jgi:molybdenum cofactor cytidylyltransferase